MPDGLLTTLPVPVPLKVTASEGKALKVPITEVVFVNVTVHEPTPLQAPDHPAKVEVPVGAAVSVTAVPLAKLALHVCPQLMPDGLLTTPPVPVPLKVTASEGKALKVPITEVVFVNVTVHEPAPLQAPDHPAKVEVPVGAAVSVTAVPLAKLALHA
jgi:hypothetical protein